MEGYDKIVAKLREIYISKNHDYGNSFDKSLDKYGIVAAVVRMGDKFNRLDHLITKDNMVAESIEDTVMDLANYAIMTARWLDNSKI